jgi:hypothetical protein
LLVRRFDAIAVAVAPGTFFVSFSAFVPVLSAAVQRQKTQKSVEQEDKFTRSRMRIISSEHDRY